jgi:hypothetical protein
MHNVARAALPNLKKRQLPVGVCGRTKAATFMDACKGDVYAPVKPMQALR